MAYYTNVYLKAFCALSITLLWISTAAVGQNCQPGYVLNPVTVNNTIEWSKFPEFSLPFKIIYSGPRFGDTKSEPLKHGFSHLAAFSGPEPGSLKASQRAALWYGVATSSGNQPWANNALRSPWGNDTAAYRSYWDAFAATVVNEDIVCLDIERMQREDRDILALKTNSQIPQNYRSLSDADFLAAYKRDIRWWYTEAANRLRAKGFKGQLTSYSDVPIRNTWLNITANSWQDWSTNSARTHYLTQDNTGKIGGSLYNAMDFLSPSPYYYYGYDNPIGKDYLSYLLFSIESNAAWSDKPIIPFVWLRVHDSYDPNIPLITSFMAQATAIFPFFSGAKGLWIWENPFLSADRQENYAAYEHFIYGLYRLSQFNDMLEGDYKVVIPQSARDNMEQQNPVWRGIVKGSNILIAAHNPYADDQQTTTIVVTYQNWVRSIALKGREVFLCKFDLNDSVTGVEDEARMVKIYPNPAANQLQVSVTGSLAGSEIEFALTNSSGQTLMQQKLPGSTTQSIPQINLPRLAAGMYFARFTANNRTVIKKVVISQ